jgi:hypothetical protein
MRSEALGGGGATLRRHPRASLEAVKDDRFSLDDSRFVRSVWVWRAFLLLAVLAVGVAIIFAGNGLAVDAVLWLVIAAGWFAFAMGLWHRHNKLDR